MSLAADIVQAFFIALAVSLLVVPLTMLAGHRFGLVSKPRLFGSSERRIPNIAGVAIAVATVAGFGVAHGLPKGIGIVALGGLLAIALGFADDRFKVLQPLVHHRLALQIAIAVASWLGGLRADTGGIAGFIVTVFVLVATMNALNLLDNMDGVAGTTAAAVAAGIAMVATIQGQFMVASLAAAVAGASLGFLPYNFTRARAYLGNGGSLLLGFLLGGLALKLQVPFPPMWSALLLVALLAVPATDTVVVVLSRLRHSRGVMDGGVDHVSHRLVRLGLTSSQAALTHGAAALMAGSFCGFAALNDVPELVLAPILILAVAGLALQKVRVYDQAVEDVPAIKTNGRAVANPAVPSTVIPEPVYASSKRDESRVESEVSSSD